VHMVTMTRVPRSPTLPTTHPNRRYMITPRIVRIDGVKTPPKVPRPAPGASSGAETGPVGSGEWSVEGPEVPEPVPGSRRRELRLAGRWLLEDGGSGGLNGGGSGWMGVRKTGAGHSPADRRGCRRQEYGGGGAVGIAAGGWSGGAKRRPSEPRIGSDRGGSWCLPASPCPLDAGARGGQLLAVAGELVPPLRDPVSTGADLSESCTSEP